MVILKSIFLHWRFLFIYLFGYICSLFLFFCFLAFSFNALLNWQINVPSLFFIIGLELLHLTHQPLNDRTIRTPFCSELKLQLSNQFLCHIQLV